jgi:hypothetical protein
MVETVDIVVQSFLILGQLHKKGEVGRPYQIYLQDYSDSNLNILRFKNLKPHICALSLNVHLGGGDLSLKTVPFLHISCSSLQNGF